MDKSDDQAYIRLQQHLDRQAVGFSATRSGAELRVLKHIFNPQEAEIAACLTYKPEPLENVLERAKTLVDSPEELAAILDEIQKKGGIEITIKDEKKRYCNPPLIVVDLNRCIGCGHCVAICPQRAVSLWENATEVIPPKTREDLYDTIMANKMGPLGKLKLMGKMTIDSLRSGQAGNEGH